MDFTQICITVSLHRQDKNKKTGSILLPVFCLMQVVIDAVVNIV